MIGCERVLIGFDDMIEDTKSNKKLSPEVTEFLLGKKTQCFTCFYISILLQSA